MEKEVKLPMWGHGRTGIGLSMTCANFSLKPAQAHPHLLLNDGRSSHKTKTCGQVLDRISVRQHKAQKLG